MKNVKLPKVLGSNMGVVMLNNAATTAPFESTMKEVNSYLKEYGALHRGAGPYANKTYDKAVEAQNNIKKFINAKEETCLVFTYNTSGAINSFIRLLDLNKTDIILTSSIEHTSNNLPYTYNSKAKVIYVDAFDDGSIDFIDLERKASKYSSHLKLIAITGASNMTGYIPDIKKISNIAHKNNALLFVDAAQLAPHRKIDMKNCNIDALAFSAHKVYAPFGLGVLAVSKSILDRSPVDPGGGSIDMISDNQIVWAPVSIRHQTGTWNVTGIVALGSSCKKIMEIGWNKIMKHERDLITYAVKELKKVPNLISYIELDKYIKEDRIGTFVFNLPGYHHSLLSSILDQEYNIETRAGTICNHKLVRRWFQINDKDQLKIEEEIIRGNRLSSYGIVRASIGIQNTKKDIDKLVQALVLIQKNGPRLKYNPILEEEIYSVIK
ncbi:MAG: aminotransferase class V-fold PLP-dependent enzyme [Candidatus Nomurabacteria bacterium]